MEALTEALTNIMVAFGVPFGICVVLPVMIVWLFVRYKSNKTNKNTEIAIAAINANPGLNIEEFKKNLNPQHKTLKERLVSKLYAGCIFLAIGVALLVYALWIDCIGDSDPDELAMAYLLGFIPLFIGVAIIIVYRISMRMHAKELEESQAEE